MTYFIWLFDFCVIENCSSLLDVAVDSYYVKVRTLKVS